jgi:hypothetical protein
MFTARLCSREIRDSCAVFSSFNDGKKIMNKTGIKELRTEKAIDLSAFAENWTAPYVERQHLIEFSGGLLDPGTMANHDSAGTGPAGRVKVGRKVIYPVQELIAWLEARASLPKKGKVGQGGEEYEYSKHGQ